MRSTQIFLAVAIGLTALLCLGSCTQAQIDRAAEISAAADARLAQADQAMALAQQAIDQGKALAEQVGSIRAEQVVAQAQQALAAAGAAREVAKVAADAGHLALTSAKQAQAAGGSTIDVIIAGITVGVPALGALALALKKLAETARDFRQTVAGVEKAKETMPADAVVKLHAALRAEQDEGTRDRVSLVKATLAGLLLFLCAGLTPGAELGLGPSPLAGSATVDSTAITDGAILNADVNASAAIAGTKVAPAFGAQNISSTNTGAASFTTAGGYTSTVATGTAPFTATSTTACPNLNASLLNGTTWTAPGAIGGGTPAAGSFTTLGATGVVSYTGTTEASAIGTANVVNAGGLSVAKKILWGGTAASAINADSINLDLVDTTASRTTQMLRINSSATTHTGYLLDVIGGGTAVTDLMFRLRANGTNLLTVVATGAATATNVWTFSNTVDATTGSSGTVITSGGIGAAKNIVGGQGFGTGLTSTATAAGTTTLSASTKSVQIFTGVTTQTVTLPAANVFGTGVTPVLWIKNLSTGLVTVQRAGSDTINSTASNVTSFTLAQWASCMLVSDGSAAWSRF